MTFLHFSYLFPFYFCIFFLYSSYSSWSILRFLLPFLSILLPIKPWLWTNVAFLPSCTWTTEHSWNTFLWILSVYCLLTFFHFSACPFCLLHWFIFLLPSLQSKPFLGVSLTTSLTALCTPGSSHQFLLFPFTTCIYWGGLKCCNTEITKCRAQTE